MYFIYLNCVVFRVARRSEADKTSYKIQWQEIHG